MTDTQSGPVNASFAAAPPPRGKVSLATSGWLSGVLTVEELRQRAWQRLPRPIFDYVDGGGEFELTMARNLSAFDRIGFRPRTVADIAGRKPDVTILGRRSAAPFGIGPMGGLATLHPDADLILARTAAKAGIPYVLATGAGASMERIAEAAPDGRRWFQLYMFSDDGLNRRLLDRAKAAGFEALIVTTDTQIGSKRMRDMRNGFGMPMRMTPKNIFEFAIRPGWLWNVARNPASAMMGNLEKEIGGVDAARAYDFFRAGRLRSVGWDEIKRIRDMWQGPMLLKGIVTAEEATRAVEFGVQGMVVSNHGGRNLDGTMATIDALPEVVAAVAGRVPVLLDSGIRRGSDVIKALALGAQGVLVGRAAAFAVAAAGAAGAEHVVAMLLDEIDRTQGLLGCSDLTTIDKSYVFRVPEHSQES